MRSIALYESQIERLFDTRKAMADAVRGHAAQVGRPGASRRARRALLGHDAGLTDRSGA